MAKNKVTFTDGVISVNGQHVGYMSSGNEVWVDFWRDPNNKVGYREFVARFKYVKPRTKAKHFVKWALQNFTPAEIIDGGKASSPIEWAESHGYVSYMQQQYAKSLLRKPA